MALTLLEGMGRPRSNLMAEVAAGEDEENIRVVAPRVVVGHDEAAAVAEGHHEVAEGGHTHSTSSNNPNIVDSRDEEVAAEEDRETFLSLIPFLRLPAVSFPPVVL